MNLDGELDGAVGQRSFGNGVVLLPGLDLGLLDRIGLEKLIQATLVAPPAVEVVVMQLACGKVADNGINPVGQSHGQAFHLAAEEFGPALDWFGQRKPATSSRTALASLTSVLIETMWLIFGYLLRA